MKRVIRVGNAQAFWGDRPSAAIDMLAQDPDLDFLTMDYLAEVSMSILALQRDRDPSKGYPKDFVEVVRQLADYWACGGRCRLIANAGGLNPLGCAEACRVALEERGCRSMKIGVVSGDDVLSIIQGSQGTASVFSNLDDQRPLGEVQSRLVTANAYMGCEGIVKALDAGADLVITGRVADPSMVVGACAHAFQWSLDNWQSIAGATVAGHLLECGTHVTGGIATDWWRVPDPEHIGFPIAEIDAQGNCVITKPLTSGGCVTDWTVKEQLVYEIGDPFRYISPDAIVSFLDLQVEEIGKDRVHVSGARGFPRPESLKVSATYRDGYRAAGTLTLFGPDSVPKAKRCGSIVLRRLKEAGWNYRDAIVECLGHGDTVPVLGDAFRLRAAYETVLRIAVESDSKQAVEAFTREMIPLVTAGPQGTTGYAEGRPSVHSVFRYWPCLIESARVCQKVDWIESKDTSISRVEAPAWPPSSTCPQPRKCDEPVPSENSPFASPSETCSQEESAPWTLPSDPPCILFDIAIGRSGDKGTGANIGVIARASHHYPFLKQWLTEERVKSFFQGLGVDSVKRFELENIGGLNFVVLGILKRGLRNDAQGKALAQALLTMPLTDFVKT